MAGTPKKRARRKAKETVERAGVQTTREHFNELIDLFKSEDLLNQLKGCIVDAVERYQGTVEQLSEPLDVVTALDKLTKVYERVEEVMGDKEKAATVIELKWADDDTDRPV